MIRLIPRPGDPADPELLSSVDEIVQARIDRRISRRQLIERAGQLGIGAAVTAICCAPPAMSTRRRAATGASDAAAGAG